MISAAMVLPLKSLTKEERPDGSNHQSFPSGHTAAAFSSAQFMFREYKDTNFWLSISGYPIAVFTGVYRALNNKHWVGDIVAGAGFGILSTEMAYWLYPKINKWIFKNKENSQTIISPYYQDKAVGFALEKRYDTVAMFYYVFYLYGHPLIKFTLFHSVMKNHPFFKLFLIDPEAEPRDSFSKKENFKKKLQKQKEKALRREERKENNNKGKNLEEMFSYVDEYGRITNTPPEKRDEISLEDIQLGAAPITPEETTKTGIITFFSEKGYGFITEDSSKENVFFHQNNCPVPLKKGNKVSFEKEKSAKGFSAINIQLDKLDKALQNIQGRGKITEINVAETVKEIRRALVDADVNYKVAKDLTKRVQEKAIGENVLTSITPGQLMTKIVHDELVDLMGRTQEGINLSVNPTIILIAGLQGSGKTTFSGKLALYLKQKRSKNPLLVACDVYRPAAIDQLTVLADQVGVAIYKEIENKNPVEISENAIKFAKENKHDVIIIDTAGRLAIDEEMMNEIRKVHQAVKPTETLFVVDSMTGQDAVNTALAFNHVLDYNGVVLTKLDGDTRGGAALTIRSVVNKPIKFISTGEKMEALDLFYPERMADRILGMGDVVSLVERAQEQFDEEEAKKLHKKIAKNEFGFDDFLKQIQQIKKMGNMKDLMGMLPGVGKAIKDVDINDDAFKHVEAIIHSMTPDERRKPSIIDMNRKKRIAKGSGRKIEDVNALMKQFDQMGKMMKMMQGPQGRQLMQMMGKGMPNMPGMGGFGK
ncbi:hypothetical protein Lal_00014611 [Lupinus albus]|nr:hypothetical protein Lal_00014611 [Lupinus albus]